MAPNSARSWCRETAHSYTATYTASSPPVVPAFVQIRSATPQTPQSTVALADANAQAAGDTNVIAVGWNDATSTIASVTDSAGNTHQLAAPVRRGTAFSQAIYYARNIKAAPAGTNTVTAQFSSAVAYADVASLNTAASTPSTPSMPPRRTLERGPRRPAATSPGRRRASCSSVQG